MTNNMPTTPVKNIDDIELRGFASPKGKFKAKLGRLGPVIGATVEIECLAVKS